MAQRTVLLFALAVAVVACRSDHDRARSPDVTNPQPESAAAVPVEPAGRASEATRQTAAGPGDPAARPGAGSASDRAAIPRAEPAEVAAPRVGKQRTAGPSTPGPRGPATGGPGAGAPGAAVRGLGGVATGSDDFYLGGGGPAGGAASRASGAESYASVPSFGFVATSATALSTFAADVDTASFANLRRVLAEGRLPPAGAIRVEELVNAQTYGDPAPAGREPFAVRTELGACPWQDGNLLLRVALRTRPIEAAKVPPCNLVFLIDVSGSMSQPSKLPLVVRALSLLVAQLRPQDRMAIVTYAAGVHTPLPRATGAEQARILEVLTDLRARGSTNGQGGIQRAYEQALANHVPEGVNRVILATDGDFNVGIREPDELERFVAERKDAGVFLTVLGVGSGNLKDDRLERLANRGNGVYAYLDSLAEARRVLVEQFGASMMTVGKDVKLQLEFDPAQVAAYRQIGYENRQLAARDFRDDAKDGGELGAGHAVTALYELVPAAPRAAGGSALATLRVRYKAPLAAKASELCWPVAATVAARPSRDFAVAATAAAFGMLLRGDAQLGTFGWDELASLAEPVRRTAPELVGVIESARRLQDSRVSDGR